MGSEGGVRTVPELPTHQEDDDEHKRSDSSCGPVSCSADELPLQLPATDTQSVGLGRSLRLGAVTVGELPSADSFQKKRGQQSRCRSNNAPRTRLGFGNISQKAKEDTLRELRKLAETDDHEDGAIRRQRSLSWKPSQRGADPSRSVSPGVRRHGAATVGELPLWLRHDWKS